MEYNFVILAYWFHSGASSDSFNLASYQCSALYLLYRSYRLVIAVVVDNLCFMPEWSNSYSYVNTHTQCSASLFLRFVFFAVLFEFFFLFTFWCERWTTSQGVSIFHWRFICLSFSIVLKHCLQTYTYKNYL